MIRLLRPSDERGVGIITAVIVAFIVFSLGAVWYSVSVHELDETTFDRHRTSALHIADAGVRRAMYELSETTLNNDPYWTGTGVDGFGNCAIEAVTTEVAGAPEQLGQYWIGVTDATPANANDHRYMIESWGWSRSTQSRQQTIRKVEQEVEIVVRRGFVYALFADSGGFAAGNQKTIYGDIYSAADIVISNNTDVWPNDAGFPGNGDVTTAGSLEVTSGSNTEIRGSVRAQDGVQDDNPGTEIWGDVTVPGGGAYFSNATVHGKVSLAGSLDPTSTVDAWAGVAPDLGVASLEAVAVDNLPTFSWADLVSKLGGVYTVDATTGPWYYWSSWTKFNQWFQANQDNVEGWHYVEDAGSNTLKLGVGGGTTFTDDFLLAYEGSLTLEGASSIDPAAAPVTISIIGVVPDSSELLFGKNMTSDDNQRWLLYSAGTVGANNLATVYGVVYGKEDVSSNHLEVHFRPPKSDVGFSFGTERRVIAQPFVWREVPDDALPCPLP
jgi:hypothetical protein